MVLLPSEKYEVRHRVQVFHRQLQQAGLPVLGGHEARPLLRDRGDQDWGWLGQSWHRDDLLQGFSVRRLEAGALHHVLHHEFSS